MDIAQYIDPTHLEEFKSVGDDFLLEILEIFKESGNDVYTKLQDAFEKADIAEIKMHAHSLKGAILNIGFIDLSKQIGAINKLAKDENLAEIEKLQPVFNEEFQRIMQMIP